MKKISLFIIITTSYFYLSGCNLFNEKRNDVLNFHAAALKALVIKAIGGNKTSDAELSNLIDLKIPVNTNYNSLQADSITTKDGKKYFYILLSYPNPFYNRFAIYDSSLKAYLIDKSLNGYLTLQSSDMNNNTIVWLREDFLSKDILSLQRTSLYLLTDTSAGLVFRSFTKLTTPKNEYTQTLTMLDSTRITTDLSSRKYSALKNKSDVFTFNSAKGRYISTKSILDNFVKKEVTNFKHEVEKPEITNSKSAYLSVGIDKSLDTIKTTSNTRDTEGYSLTLTDNWKTLKNFDMDDLFTQQVTGTRYVNEVLGASISVIKLSLADSAEMFINYKLVNSSNGKYHVRYSDKIVMKKDFIQFFEFTCGSKKYLLVLRASKYTYEQYKKIYSSIIDSFTIDC